MRSAHNDILSAFRQESVSVPHQRNRATPSRLRAKIQGNTALGGRQSDVSVRRILALEQQRPGIKVLEFARSWSKASRAVRNGSVEMIVEVHPEAGSSQIIRRSFETTHRCERLDYIPRQGIVDERRGDQEWLVLTRTPSM